MSGRSPAFQQFLASTSIDDNAWHDGIGYDLATAELRKRCGVDPAPLLGG